MINQNTQTILVKIYLLICEKYESELQFHCQRFSNNNSPSFTDQEVITIYLFCVHVEKRFKVKDMYQFIKSYYSDWFPKLHSYVAFNSRINNLAYVFQLLSESLMKEFTPENSSDEISLLDSIAAANRAHYYLLR